MSLNWQQIELVDRLSATPPKLGNWIRTERAPIFGGWLIRTILVHRESAQVSGSAIEPEFSSSVALTFVPDPAWTWHLK